MKATKALDCVELKNAIQARLLAEREGMSDDEVRALVRRRLATSDSPIAQLWRRLTPEQGDSTH